MNIRSVIGSVFDEVSGTYDSLMDGMVPHYRDLISSIFAYLPADFNPLRCLELGCGNGNSSLVAARLFKGCPMDMVDASEEMLTICRNRMGPGPFDYKLALFQEIELKPDNYDLVFACFSLHHLDGLEKREFFKIILNSLRSGGIFACSDLFIEKNSAAHAQHLIDWKAYCLSNGKTEEDWAWLMDHYDAYDRPSAFEAQAHWLAEAGFVDINLSWNDGQWGCFHAHKK